MCTIKTFHDEQASIWRLLSLYGVQRTSGLKMVDGWLGRRLPQVSKLAGKPCLGLGSLKQEPLLSVLSDPHSCVTPLLPIITSVRGIVKLVDQCWP